MADLKALVAMAQRRGWASGSGDIDTIRQQAASLGLVEVATRRGDATVSVLRATDASAAHPKSLSAAYGLGQQPLHTDGAHLPDPPDLIVLISPRPSTTPTRLWKASRPIRGSHLAAGLPAALRHGMFLVHNGSDSFFAPAWVGTRDQYAPGWYRYDPGCMTACDARAREVEQYFTNQLADAATHEWSDADQVLVVDNRRTLHARSAVAKDDMDRELTRVAFRAMEAQ